MVNAFWLDHDLDRAARWHDDDHVLSGVLECCTVLTTAAKLRGHPDDSLTGGYEHNPLTRWAADSVENWRHLRDYVASVQEEWRYRWDHAPDETHGAWEPVYALDDTVLDGPDWPSTSPTTRPRSPATGRPTTTSKPTASTTPTRRGRSTPGRRTGRHRRGSTSTAAPRGPRPPGATGRDGESVARSRFPTTRSL
jgi:hypothetical protein